MDVRRDDYAEAFSRIAYKKGRIHDERVRSLEEIGKLAATERNLRQAALRSGVLSEISFRPAVRGTDDLLFDRPGVIDVGFVHRCDADAVKSYSLALGDDPGGTIYDVPVLSDDQEHLGAIRFSSAGAEPGVEIWPRGGDPVAGLEIIRLIGGGFAPSAWGELRVEALRRSLQVVADLDAAYARIDTADAARRFISPHVADFPRRVDWSLLRGQMDTLARLDQCDRRITDVERRNAIEGVLNLLGALKDYAVDVCRLDEDLVFGPSEEIDALDTVAS